MKRKYVLTGLGLIATLAIVSPVMAGESLSSLVKKEVAKQLDDSATVSAKAKRGPRGPRGPAGAPGAPGAPGTPGTPGANGTGRAYAYVDHFTCNSTVPDPCALAASKGVTSVTQVAAGVYCAVVPGLSPTTAPSVASVDSAQSFPGNASNEVLVNGLDSGACTLGQYEFLTFDPADPTANRDTSFTFVIP